MRDIRDSLILAVLWFTRIGLPLRATNISALQQQSLAWLPLVGALIGFFPWAVLTYANGWGNWITGLVALGVLLYLTGALHEDGWADGWDALGAGGSREKSLQILKDPRLGVFGVCALVFSLLMQWLCMVSLANLDRLWMIPLLHAVSRFPMAPMAWRIPYVRKNGEGKAEFLHEPAQRWAWVLWMAWIPVFALVALWGGLYALDAIVMTLLISCLAMVPWVRRLGGVTGDIFGFCQQAGLFAGLLFAVWGE